MEPGGGSSGGSSSGASGASGGSSSGVSGDSNVGGRRSRAVMLESSLEHDSHNDSGYSTRMCSSSQGPSPALSGMLVVISKYDQQGSLMSHDSFT